MTELRDFASKTDAEAFLDWLERAGGEAVFISHLADYGRWLVEFVPPAAAEIVIGPRELAELCDPRPPVQG
jgi:hypothetical protein